MITDPYRQLARRLDAIPNGFPPTESGIEFELLAYLFTPEEAALASHLKLTFEPAADIAARAELEERAAHKLLKGMARKRLIYLRKKDQQFVFALMPFVVGIYEEQVGRLDTRLAELFEQYYQASQGSIMRNGPSVHRVIPVEETLATGLEIFPYERATRLIEEAKAWGVRECICRKQQQLLDKGCERPMETCLVFAPMENVFDHSENTRAISKTEALTILAQAEEAGLVHSTGNYRDHHFYICNCCTCCCGVLRSIAEFELPTAVAHSNFQAVVDEDICSACGDCLARCQFDAITVEFVAEINMLRCVGCGLCATACSTGAITLNRREEEKLEPVPANLKEWMAVRAKARDIPMDDVM